VDGDKFLQTRAVDGRLVALAARYRVPAIYVWSIIAWTGGLITYGASRELGERQMGVYAGRILKGAKPAHLPFERVAKFELFINTKTAKALDLSVPQLLLAQADEVIK
jgi:putative ABC transport system substrate-binding protein